MPRPTRCAHCILPDSLPSVRLDTRGVCNHCRTYESLQRNSEEIAAQKRQELEDLLQRAKRLNRRYDCLIPLSGGKDSTYVLYLCDKVYRLRCLCVTFDNGFLSEHARANIRSALNATGADHIYYTVNRNLLLKLYRLFLLKCGQFCPVCMHGIGLCNVVVSRDYGIPLIISGTGWRVTYLGLFPELFQGGNLRFFRNVVKGEPIEEDAGPMLLNPWPWNARKMLRIASRLLRIRPRDPRTVSSIGIYDYLAPSYDEIYRTIEREMGWHRPTDKAEHMDCMVHELPFYMHTLKFPELTPSTIYHSGLIRLGAMDREQAMEIEREKFANPQEPKMLEPFLREIGVSRDEFESSVRDWRKIEQFRDRKTNALRSIYRKITGG